jgi:iron complex outermembrane receptor protein
MQMASMSIVRHVVALCAAGISMTALGEDAAVGRDAGAVLDEIVVTAQKRETNLQDTPISIAVLSGEDLADRRVISLASLADGSVPSLRIAPFATRSSALNIGIRGVGASGDANQPARDAGVGVYVDGVFLGRAQGLGAALLDVERIEVLKGPQGTLFGRNSEGGAISIITKAPRGEFNVDTRVGVSNFGGRNAAIRLDLPAMGDVSIKLDGLVNQRDGTTRNPADGEGDFNGWEKRGVRLSALWKPVENFQVTYAYDNSRDATTPYHVQLLTAGPFASPLQRAGVSEKRRDAAILGGAQQDSVGKTSGHLLVFDWQVGEQLQLRSISSYRDLEQSQYDQGFIDAISTFAPGRPFARYSLANVVQHQYSEELQLIGRTEQLEYVGGAFFYRESAADDARTPQMNLWNANGTAYTVNPATTPLDPSRVTVDRASRANTESVGLFGQVVWTPADLQRLHLTVGGRYTRDAKDGRLSILNGAASTLSFDDAWSRFDPMVSAAWDLGDDAMVYAKWSTGFKAGGANSRSLSYRAFAPEEVTALEAGLKSQFLGDRLRLNLTLFDATIKDKQMDFFFPLTVGGSQRTVSDTTNASTDGDSKGAEVELVAVPNERLTLGLNYTRTNIDALNAPNPYVAGNPLARVLPLYAPENAGSLSLDYVLPLGPSKLKFHIDGNWSDGFYTSEIEQTLTGESVVVNTRLSLADVALSQFGAVAEFSLWARNLLDEEHIFYKSTSTTLGTYGIFNEPRTYGIEARLRFGGQQ